ncbi:MAG: hypothetical protein AAEC86_04205 [Pseudohongiellaceae bacterium]
MFAQHHSWAALVSAADIVNGGGHASIERRLHLGGGQLVDHY